MPKRTNLFQEVVEIVHRQMVEGAEDVEVEDSGFLTSRSTEQVREVDVVIRGRIGGYPLIVSIEAIDRSRKADQTWVDGMLGKHADLPTNKLVLVSARGFSKTARQAAEHHGALAIAPEDLVDTDGSPRPLPAIVANIVKVQIQELSVQFAENAPHDGWDHRPIIGTQDEPLGELEEFVAQMCRARGQELHAQIGTVAVREDESRTVEFRFEHPNGELLQIPVDGELKTLHLVNANGLGYTLRWVLVKARVDIVAGRVELKGGRMSALGRDYAYGEGTIGGRDALVVVSQPNGADKATLTMRIRPEPPTS